MSLKRCRRGSTPERMGVRGSRVPCTCPCHRESRSSRRRRALDGCDRPDSALGGSLARLGVPPVDQHGARRAAADPAAALRPAQAQHVPQHPQQRALAKRSLTSTSAPFTFSFTRTFLALTRRSILKAVIARHEPQALAVQIPGRDRHGDTARAYLSTAVRSAPHGVDGRVSLQSRMRLRSANSHPSWVLTNVSRYRSDAIMILRSPSAVNR